MSSAFKILQGARVLDLRNDYHLAQTREGDEWKTAFNTLFEYWVFGLVNSLSVFSVLVNNVLTCKIFSFSYILG